jgi:cell division protein FtsZ
MSNAGSALMGIGRANGDDRAIKAAQQAVESPLLEISIDGARGILFNVIGGMDMSMHEINTAAETITAAADPDANIIFGATINPELEGEIIITVVATGFDAAYFSNREALRPTAVATPVMEPVLPSPGPVSEPTKQDEKLMKDMDMELESPKSEGAEEFEKPLPNIWTLDANDEDEEDAGKAANDNRHVVGSILEDDELEKPSFLRRLKNRRKTAEKDDSAEEATSDNDGK